LTDQKKTQFDLEEMVRSATEEFFKSLIQTDHPQMNRRLEDLFHGLPPGLYKHIALTIVGELHELEVIRKIGPMFRMIESLKEDFRIFDERGQEDYRIRNLRIQLPTKP